MSASAVQGLVAEYLRRLGEREAARAQESPEAQLADLIPELLIGIAATLNRPHVDLLGQAYEREIGRPDFSVRDGGLLIGHVETKPPGAGADVRRFRGHDRYQWHRFQKLPNLL